MAQVALYLYSSLGMESRISMISLGSQCWVSKLLRESYPGLFVSEQNVPTGVFDLIGTAPSMVAHVLTDHFQTLSNPGMYRPVGRRSGHFQNEFYEDLLREQALMYLDYYNLEIPDEAWSFLNSPPALFRHNTEHGLQSMCETLARRGARMDSLLRNDNFKVLVWGMAIPYNHYVWAKRKQLPIEEIIQEELSTLFEALTNHLHLEHFCLVGLLVIANVPEQAMLHDKEYPVTFLVRDTFATMKRVAVTSSLHGATWKGHQWADERMRICRFLNSCEDLMYQASRASISAQAPTPSSVPFTSLALRSNLLALGDEVHEV